MTDAKTLWRETGDTDLSSFTKALSRSWMAGTSPMAADAKEVYEYLRIYGLTRLGAAMAWHESKNGSWNCSTAPAGQPCIPAINRNPFAMKAPDGTWATFLSYADAALAWASRLTDAKGPYAKTRTLSELINVYAPAFENDVDLYVRTVAAEIDRLPLLGEKPVDDPKPLPPQPEATWVEHQMAGSPKMLRLPKGVTFSQRIIKSGQWNQRPGIRMTPAYYTQHETGNSNRGADAEMHANWLHAGAAGVPDAQVGFHFVVDDRKIIQLLPVNEVAWHAGDGSGPGNYSSIGCELCVNSDRSAIKAEANAAALAAGVMEALGIAQDRLRTHYSWVKGKPGAHFCPEKILTRDGWAGFVEAVATAREAIREGEARPAVEFACPDVPVAMAKELFPMYDPEGARTRLWLQHGAATGCLPRFKRLWKGSSEAEGWTECLEFDGGLLIFSDGGDVWTL